MLNKQHKMLNKQHKEKLAYREDGALDIVKIWDTIQGEGPFAGKPAIFIRLAGCNLQCPLCDTDYTSRRELMSLSALQEQVLTLSPVRRGLVVLTGGEPLRQNLEPFVNMLLGGGFLVQIETNGTVCPDDPRFLEFVLVVCSPKSPSISEKLLPYISSYKYVLQHDFVDPEDGLPLIALGGMKPARPPMTKYLGNDEIHYVGGRRREIYLQPCDEQDAWRNKLNQEAVVDSCLTYGYTLCLQLHKLVGLE